MIVNLTNKNYGTGYPTVRDIFYGYTQDERNSWYITLPEIQLPTITKYNYLILDNDVYPHTFNRVFYASNVLRITGAIPFSLDIDSTARDVIIGTLAEGQESRMLFIDYLDTWFDNLTLSISYDKPLPSLPAYTGTPQLVSDDNIPIPRINRLYGATNRLWNNTLVDSINAEDNEDYYQGDDYVYQRYFANDGTDLNNEIDMTNPYTLEIHKALNAGNYQVENNNDQHTLDYYIINNNNNNSSNIKISEIHKALSANDFCTNVLAVDSPRVTTLGWYIKNIARVLGLRRNDKGEIDYQLERDKYSPKTLNNPKYKIGEYSTNQFGDYGLMIPHLPTKYDSVDKLKEQFDVVYDIPQLIQAVLNQLDISLGIQHGSEIRVPNIDDKIGRFPNQLALLIDIQRRLQEVELYALRTHNNSIVSGAELRGLYAGIGVPVSQKFLEVEGKEKRKLPYFSFQQGQPSILNQLTTLKINIAVIIGMLSPQKGSGNLNPFKRFKKKDK